MKKEFRFKIDVPKYVYPVGLAGKKFAEGLKEGKVYIAFCEKCSIYYMPPTAFCPRCFGNIHQFKEATNSYLDLYTVIWKDMSGKDLEKPIVYGFIRFEVDDEIAEGGLIHRVNVENIDDLVLGIPVKPVFKPSDEREGLITDILYFEPK